MQNHYTSTLVKPAVSKPTNSNQSLYIHPTLTLSHTHRKETIMPRRNKRSQMHTLEDSFALATMDIMIGDACPCGPGGRDCPCCGDAPGKDRVAARRMNKRRKRQEFKRSLQGYYRSPREYYEYEYAL